MINEDKIYKIVSNLFEDLSRYKASLNESFKSSILRDVFTKNHDRDAWAKMRHYGQIKLDYDNMWLDLHNITDDMIDGVYNSPKEANIEPRTTKVPYITFRNGVTVVFNDKIKEIETPAENKFNERERNNRFRFNNDGRYISNNPHYNTFRDTRSMWNKDIENGDKPYFNGDTETKRNSTPSVVKNSYYQAAKDRYNKMKQKAK